MKRLLLFMLCLTTGLGAFAQAPVIEGDVMLCPDTNGTARITNDATYSSYQWYGKYWFLPGDFEPIEGATLAEFTYDWYTYDQMQLKVVVTEGNETFESNVIQIDSYAWASLLVSTTTSGNVTQGEYPVYLLCEGGSITNTVLEPYTIVQWYRDGEPIEGATDVSYTITEPGEYHVVAAPAVCPNSTSTSLHTIVQANPDCESVSIVPVINGSNLMMCPDTTEQAFIADGLVTYDSYQWYYKYWFLSDDYAPIEGATDSTFMYDWYTYDQALLKLVVTLDGQTYESNSIQIDSYNWVSLSFTMDFNEGVTPDDATQTYLLCPDGAITCTLPELFSENIQWFRDGEPIEGANQRVYVITEEGSYYVEASPNICPFSSNSTIGTPVPVGTNTECTTGLDNVNSKFVTLYPNPANTSLNVDLSQISGFENYTIYDVTGKKLLDGNIESSLTTINIAGLSAGSYIIKLNGSVGQASKMFIKQ
ncbi:T9SS type A sorting domain-containing protein [Flavobacterium sp. Sd200]|uniref:T9SS type A sorting domain-containing protein n=1 Tax=Flavobacterium sp. Sd200 TaxID=2692211 RepID=UPI00136CBBD9|nr:T9SS type A sorting domain-containing protein [Flavobacterium sp. Sd200]MXN91786.1 T9SS type A sorting domain-containing protein [Flavobacterium sp. Sd200]